uniref:Uncharacterized protein n=1 Tax=Solanum lycopersicum TaxID=4081 RepID=A0A3Q7IQU8_SOLLC
MNRDEDLLLFTNMYKREKNDLASLLLPVPDEFEANGRNYALYRMTSSKKNQAGLDYMMNIEVGKNDYDWLKTPPATPLFPSLDMEANAPEFVIQKEIPIIQPVVTLSRFAGGAKTRSALVRSSSPNQKPKIDTKKSTQIGKQNVSSIEEKKNTRFATTTMIKSNTSNDHKERSNTLSSIATRTTKQKDSGFNFLASNLSKTLRTESSLSNTKPKSRGASPAGRLKSRGESPAGRPRILGAQFPGFSDETPPNLKTDRSLVTRGRKQEISTSSTKIQHGNVTTQVLGSKMVDKFMNARKSIHEEKAKLNSSMNESSGFGRHISRISANMAHKHMEIHQDTGNSGKNGTITGRKSSNIRGSKIPSA